MQFTMATILAAALATVVSSSTIEKRAFPSIVLQSSIAGLDGLMYNNLAYSSSSAYIGNIKYSTESEPLLLSGGSSGFSFTSFHSSPTGSQRMLIYPDESKPISFTIPHSGAVPAGATPIGFSQDGNSLLFNEENKWKACPVPDTTATWQIYWDGAETLTDCVSIDLTVMDTCSA